MDSSSVIQVPKDFWYLSAINKWCILKAMMYPRFLNFYIQLSASRCETHSILGVKYLDCERWGSRVIAINRVPVFVDQELSKIPLDVITKDSPLPQLQELVQRSSIMTIHFNLIQVEQPLKRQYSKSSKPIMCHLCYALLFNFLHWSKIQGIGLNEYPY